MTKKTTQKSRAPVPLSTYPRSILSSASIMSVNSDRVRVPAAAVVEAEMAASSEEEEKEGRMDAGDVELPVGLLSRASGSSWRPEVA